MKSKLKRKIVASNTFWCLTCNDDKEMTPEQAKDHLKSVHSIGGEIKGFKRMTMHVDGSDYFKSNYEWVIDGIKLHQHTMNPRKDRSMWED